MKNLIEAFSPARVSIIVNEFGKESIDGPLLTREGVPVEEIVNGSIFCVCRSDLFVEVLVRALRSDAEYVLVETSGLSDPTGIDKILETVSAIGTGGYDFRGVIAVVDVTTVLKLLHTAVAVRQQIRSAGLILLNKTDLASPEEIAAVRETVSSISPAATVRETNFSRLSPAWLRSVPMPSTDGDISLKTLGTQRFLIEIPPEAEEARLIEWLKAFSHSCYRIKGFVSLASGWKRVDAVANHVELRHWEAQSRSRLVILAPGTVRIKDDLIRSYRDIFGGELKFC